MTRVICLEKVKGYFKNANPIAVSQGEECKIGIASNYNLSESYITFENGDTIEEVKIDGMTTTIPQEVLFTGWLKVAVNMYLNGKPVKSWLIPPIRVIENDTKTVDGLEIVQAHDTEIATLKEGKASKEELQAEVEKLQEQIDLINTNLSEFVVKYNKLADIVALLKENN